MFTTFQECSWVSRDFLNCSRVFVIVWHCLWLCNTSFDCARKETIALGELEIFIWTLRNLVPELTGSRAIGFVRWSYEVVKAHNQSVEIIPNDNAKGILEMSALMSEYLYHVQFFPSGFRLNSQSGLLVETLKNFKWNWPDQGLQESIQYLMIGQIDLWHTGCRIVNCRTSERIDSHLGYITFIDNTIWAISH